jgi:hypothetical protein
VGLPILGPAATWAWDALALDLARGLVDLYRGEAAALRDLYASCAASRYLPESTGFGEFFCWYDHVAYAHAIDELARQGRLLIPAERYSAMLWFEHPEKAFT